MFLSWWHYFVEKKKEKISSCFSTVARLRYGEGCCCLQLSRRKRRFCCYRVRPASWNNESVCVCVFFLPHYGFLAKVTVSMRVFPHTRAHSGSQIKSLPFHSTLPVQVTAVLLPFLSQRAGSADRQPVTACTADRPLTALVTVLS